MELNPEDQQMIYEAEYEDWKLNQIDSLQKRVNELETHIQEAVELMTQEQLRKFNKIVSEQ